MESFEYSVSTMSNEVCAAGQIYIWPVLIDVVCMRRGGVEIRKRDVAHAVPMRGALTIVSRAGAEGEQVLLATFNELVLDRAVYGASGTKSFVLDGIDESGKEQVWWCRKTDVRAF